MRAGLLLSACLLWPIASMAQQPRIDIKGVSIGMPKAEVEERLGDLSTFTIAGVSSKYRKTPVALHYRDGLLDGLSFFFDSKSFETVLGAVQGKFPGIPCRESEVSNAMNARFTQVVCTLEDETGYLRLTRFVSDVSSSSLTLVSRQRLNEFRDAQQQKKKDI